MAARGTVPPVVRLACGRGHPCMRRASSLAISSPRRLWSPRHDTHTAPLAASGCINLGTVGLPRCRTLFNATLQVGMKHARDRKTKIICTVGPATSSDENLRRLLSAGMNVMRINMSHSNHEQAADLIQRMRAIVAFNRKRMTPHQRLIDFTDGSCEDLCGIAVDTKGPEIRTGRNEGGKDVAVNRHDTIVLTTDPQFSECGNASKLFVDHADLPSDIHVGQRIYIDDGLVALDAIAINGGDIECRIRNDGLLGQNKGVNIPGAVLSLPAVTERDIADLKFAVEQRVDFVFASFVRRKEHVLELREALGEAGKNVSLISKIENEEGVANFNDILYVSDGIMVARGDLGIEIPPEQVVVAQKMMLARSYLLGKPSICATQMLESMIHSPRPTRAEVNDVANAVLDGASCVMLSGETSKGKYPVEAVDIMGKICQETENVIDYDAEFDSTRSFLTLQNLQGNSLLRLAAASSAVNAAYHIQASLIIVLARTGNTVRDVARCRPKAPILAVVSDEAVATKLLVLRGVIPMLAPHVFTDTLSEIVKNSIEFGKELGICEPDDRVVVVASDPDPKGRLPFVKLVMVEEDD